MSPADDREAQVPLVELLLSVPADARLSYKHSPTDYSMYPVGRLCHEAAAALSTARAGNREAFEAWCDREYRSNAWLHKSSTSGEWEAWQAGASTERARILESDASGDSTEAALGAVQRPDGETES